MSDNPPAKSARAGVLVTVALYGFAAVWLWRQRAELAAPTDMDPWGLALVAIIVITLNIVLLPARLSWLLGGAGARVGLLAAIRDRLLLATTKAITPLRLGDPLGFYAVTRRWGVGWRDSARVWTTEKLLTLVANGVILAFILVRQVGTTEAALALASALVVVFLIWTVVTTRALVGTNDSGTVLGWARRVSGMVAYRLTTRMLMVATSLAVELLEIVVFMVFLSASVGEWPGLLPQVMVVHAAAMVPTLFGGAGSREAATLVVFAGHADAGSLFVAGLGTNLALRILPALPGLIWLPRYTASPRESP